MLVTTHRIPRHDLESVRIGFTRYGKSIDFRAAIHLLNVAGRDARVVLELIDRLGEEDRLDEAELELAIVDLLQRRWQRERRA